MPEEVLPVTLVTGFLGSGKTTLLNHILTARRGHRTAVLVNEFGELGIDAELIVSTEGDMVELANGCICCSINEDLVRAVARVLEQRHRVNCLLVETSGLADPMPVAMTFVGRDLEQLTRLDAIITMVDSENYAHAESTVAGYNQIRFADLLLLNKADRVDDARLEDLEARLRDIKKGVRILRTTRARAPLPLVLDLARFKPTEVAQPCPDHLDQDGFTSLSFQSDRPVVIEKLQHFLAEQLPQEAFRVKGLLSVAGRPERYVLHMTGRRFTLDRGEWGAPAHGTRLVIIGRNLDHEVLRAQLGACFQ
ncbi:MAG: hypothetical cobalamin synthesis protein P47K/CobW [Candidatus Xenobia bacterium]